MAVCEELTAKARLGSVPAILMSASGSAFEVPRHLPTAGRVWLVAITLAGGLARVLFQLGRPFYGDEVGTLLYMRKPASYILSHFDTWLSMNFYILLEKWLAEHVCGGDWCLVAPTLLASIATIPAVASLTLKVTDRPIAVAAAVLTAFDPFLISYGSQLRSYSLLVLFSVLAVDRMLSWVERPTWTMAAICSLCVLLGTLLNPNMLHTFLYVLVIAIWGALGRRVRAVDLVKCFVAFAVSAFLLVALYWRIYPDFAAVKKHYSASPPTFQFFPTMVFESYMGDPYMKNDSSAPAAIALLLVGIGIFLAPRRASRALVLVPGVVLPFAVASLTGLVHYPWAIARFFIFIIPYLLILVAAGAVWGAAELPNVARSIKVAVGLLLLGALWLPTIRSLIRENAAEPFKEAATVLLQWSGPASKVVADGLDNVALRPYFRCGDEIPYYPEPRVLDLIDVAQAAQSEPDDFFFVTTARPLLTRNLQRRLGDISIVQYVSDARASAIERFRADFRATIAGNADRSLKTHYGSYLRLSNDPQDPARHDAADKLGAVAKLEHPEEWTPAVWLKR
jgi:hypothetical protein